MAEDSMKAMKDLTVTMGVLRQGLEENGFSHEESVDIAKEWLIKSTIAIHAKQAVGAAATLSELLAKVKTQGKPS